jgi:hypothetical protein
MLSSLSTVEREHFKVALAARGIRSAAVSAKAAGNAPGQSIRRSRRGGGLMSFPRCQYFHFFALAMS